LKRCAYTVPVLLPPSEASLEELMLEPIGGVVLLLLVLVLLAASASHPRHNSLLWPLGHDAPRFACPSENLNYSN